jgi:hypothetical protein
VSAGIIAVLQGQASLEGLEVGEPGLSFDAGMPRGRGGPPDIRVPGPEVALDWQRHFRPPAQARMEAAPESLQEGKLRPVADRVTGGIGAKAELESQDGAISAEELKVREFHVATLESTDSCVRRANRSADLPLAQAGPDPDEPTVVRDSAHSVSAAPSTSIGNAFARCHKRRSSHGPLTWRSTRLQRTPSVRSGGWARPNPPERPVLRWLERSAIRLASQTRPTGKSAVPVRS